MFEFGLSVVSNDLAILNCVFQSFLFEETLFEAMSFR